ncbi:cytochrome P450 2J5-like [Hemicordylus capensis]|uniref:cytochrome P450 2J5-like n=1 Tax=Hemicordylus capensis TaxID=884348 RepID=UPI00230303DC|nr:cytochrome P450 2J5-like [Hemicordylus capensis]
MAVMQIFFLALLVGLLTLYFLKQLWSRRHYPYGPLPLPLIGDMWQIGIRLYQDTLIKQQPKQHGNKRLVTPFLNAVTKEDDLVYSNGDIWKQQRLIGQMTMKKLGSEKKGIEHQIEEEARQLVETFARVKSKPLDPLLPITTSVCNVICAMAFGHRFSVKDEEFQKLIEAIDVALKCGGSFVYALYEMFPRLMKYLPGPHKKALSSREMVLSFAKRETEKHKKHRTQHGPLDFIDFYLSQMKAKSKGDPNTMYNDQNLAQCVLDLFISGTESTATTLQWGLLLMATYPDIQGKVQNEMEDVLGSTHSIHYQDWKKLSYTSAVIHEIQRAKYAFLFKIISCCAKDVNVFGFLIPKGTFLNPDLHSFLLDPKRWETPEKFNPNHFLNKDGHFVAMEELLLFSAGDHECLEEQVTQIELFIFFTSLLRAFTFQLPEREKEFKEEPAIGLTTYPHSYQLCAIPRFRAS